LNQLGLKYRASFADVFLTKTAIYIILQHIILLMVCIAIEVSIGVYVVRFQQEVNIIYLTQIFKH